MGYVFFTQFCKMMLETQDAVKKVAYDRMEKRERRLKSDLSPKPRSKAASKLFSSVGDRQ